MYEYLKDRLDLLDDKLKDYKSVSYNVEYHKNKLSIIKNNIDSEITASFDNSKTLVEDLLLALCTYKNLPRPNNSNIQSLYGNVRKKYIKFITKDAEDTDRVFNNTARNIIDDRNHNSDSCHGRDPIDISQLPLSRQHFYVDFCLSVFKYCLNGFIEQIDIDYADSLKYENNEAFNAFLDDSEDEFNRLLLKKGIKHITYSKLLYNEDPDKYREDLEDYIDYKENKELGELIGTETASKDFIEPLEHEVEELIQKDEKQVIIQVNTKDQGVLDKFAQEPSISAKYFAQLNKDSEDIAKKFKELLEPLNIENDLLKQIKDIRSSELQFKEALYEDIFKSSFKTHSHIESLKDYFNKEGLGVRERAKYSKLINSVLDEKLSDEMKEKIIKLIEESDKNKG